jgi:hypothetical protein
MDGGLVPELVDNLLAVVAEEEVRRMGARSRQTRAFLEEAGWFFPTRAAWGYRLRPSTPDEQRNWAPTKVLEPDPVTGPAVTEIWNRAARGIPFLAIARWAQMLPETVRAGHMMSAGFIYSILTNPTYVARPRQGLTDVLARPRGRWPALATDAQWTIVQDLIAGHRRPIRHFDPHALLRALLCCPTCGAPMTRRHESTTGVARYACRGAVTGYGAASVSCNATVLASAVEQATVVAVHDAVRAAIAVAGQHAQSESRLVGPGRRREEARLRRALDLVDGRTSVRQYRAWRQMASAMAVNDREVGGSARVVDSATVGTLREWEVRLSRGTPTEQHEILRRLLTRVVPMRERRGIYRVALTWAEHDRTDMTGNRAPARERTTRKFRVARTT